MAPNTAMLPAVNGDPLPLSDAGFARLRHVVARLRGPDGCPWDRAQTIDSARRYLLNEVYEALEALDPEPGGALADSAAEEELGDVLFQLAFLAQLFSERGAFDLESMATRAANKMIARHPHVFADAHLETAEDVQRSWSELKARQRGEGIRERSVLDGVPGALPALEKAQELSSRAAQQGFDWPDAAAVFEKVDEETRELREAVQEGRAERTGEELGDLLFAVANLARKLGHDPERVLQRANTKFGRRFRFIEKAARGRNAALSEFSPDSLESLWSEAKRQGL